MLIKNSHKTLVILDLDETLLHGRETPLDRKEDFKVFSFFIYKRPYLEAFLDALKENFLVAVWSSASDNYVAKIVQHIFPNDYPLEFVWGRSRCTYRSKQFEDNYGRYLEDYETPYFYLKSLLKVKKQGFKLDRILIIDDSPEKCQNNYGNAIYPQEYLGQQDDKELLFLSKYLKSLKDELHLRSIEKRGWKSTIDLHL